MSRSATGGHSGRRQGLADSAYHLFEPLERDFVFTEFGVIPDQFARPPCLSRRYGNSHSGPESIVSLGPKSYVIDKLSHHGEFLAAWFASVHAEKGLDC